ncbi:MAG: lysylphosphatidylglycerol synthase transmembrane domain-containing protein [Phototrophicaceae bacterium]
MIRKWLIQFTVWGSILILLMIALREVELAQIIPLLQQLTYPQVSALLLMNGLVIVCFAWRWQVILQALHPVGFFWRLCLHRLGGFGVSYFTPGPQVGGEPIQLALLQREGVSSSVGIASIGLDKLIEVSTNLMVVLLGLVILLNTQLPADRVYLAIVLGGLGLGLPISLLYALWRGFAPISTLLDKLPRVGNLRRLTVLIQVIQQSEESMMTFLQTQPRATLNAFGISFISWIGLMASYWFMASFIGIHLTFVELISLLMAQQVAFLLPLPGGLGALESSQTLMFGLLGYDPSIGITLSLLMRVRDVTFGLLGLGWVALAWKADR